MTLQGSRGVCPPARDQGLLDLVEEVVGGQSETEERDPEDGVAVERDCVLTKSILDDVLGPGLRRGGGAPYDATRLGGGLGRGHRPGRVVMLMASGLSVSAKKSLPLSSTTMKAGKSSTSIFHTASMPSSGYSSTSTWRMQS